MGLGCGYALQPHHDAAVADDMDGIAVYDVADAGYFRLCEGRERKEEEKQADYSHFCPLSILGNVKPATPTQSSGGFFVARHK
jgi:hypothetical protein